MARARPGRQRNIDDTFIGRAAQLAVIAELLRHRCNAAIPQVDIGTDVFAFMDDSAEVVRIQVKACAVPKTFRDGSGYSARFTLPLKQLEEMEDAPHFDYALAVLRDGRWSDFLVISRERLQLYNAEGTPFGSRHKTNEDLQITVEFRTAVTCSGRDLADCRNAWTSLPPFRSTPIPPQRLRGTRQTRADDR